MTEHSITYRIEEGVVSISIQGTLNQKTARKFLSQAVDLASRHECHKFLSDLRQATILEGTFGILDHVKELGEIGLKKGDLFAVIAQNDLSAHKFFETAARNRGWYSIRYFHTEADAIEWLGTG